MNASADERALLAFSLGPVQSFIAAARSVRDLWTGSYLLSWLTYRAMRPILTDPKHGPAAFVFPSVERHPLWCSDEDNPLQQPGTAVEQLSPSLPNRFLAEIDGADAPRLAEACELACRDAWQEIESTVFNALQSQVATLPHAGDWNREAWDQQVNSCFEIRTVVLPAGDEECPHSDIQRLLPPSMVGDRWTLRWQVLQRLLAAERSVRHVPNYVALPDVQNNVPAKCTVLGTYEQMGPAELEKSREFWEAFAKNVEVAASRTRKRERLCAVSLVKRFGYFAYIKRRLDLPVWKSVLEYPDTATVAAAEWLKSANPKINILHRDWSGQWLHWRRPDQDADEPACPEALFGAIQQAKWNGGAPPAYYAVVALDGDNMGDRLRKADRPRQRELSDLLTGFAIEQARRIVEQFKGTLIYAGGDDVLALMPAIHGLECANKLQMEFRKCFADAARMSAGIAIVHYKEDLRFALDVAHRAEKRSKELGRNCVSIAVCRRSGEHASSTMPWTFVPTFQGWVNAYQAKPKASDRWAYDVAQELHILEALPVEAMALEITRQVKRSDETTRRSHAEIDSQFRAYVQWTKEGQSPRSMARPVLREFIGLAQSASFLTRGGDA